MIEAATIDTVMRTLADPTRRAVFERIVGADEITVVELTRGSGVTQGAVSQHLKSLKLAGLVAERPEGRKVYYRAEPEGLAPLVDWMEYFGRSNHKKLLDGNANFEDFEVDSPKSHLHIKAQTLRMYNPTTHQWSIYGVDLDNGVLGMPPVVGQFDGPRGEFIDQEPWKGRQILVRYVWQNLSPTSARMEQSFSADDGRTWEVNWICELSR